MKKIIPYLLFFVVTSSLFPTNAQSKIDEKSKLLEGIWMLKAERASNRLKMGFLPVNPGSFKIISTDGKFTNFIMKNFNTFINVDGLFHVESDTVFVESIKRSLNPSLIGKNNKLFFKMEKNNKLYLKWFLEKNFLDQKIDIWVEEVWEKVEMPTI